MASHVSTLDSRKRVRRTFGHSKKSLICQILLMSSDLAMTIFADGRVTHERTDHGLQETFKSVFPIGDFAGRSVLEFVSYELKFKV